MSPPVSPKDSLRRLAGVFRDKEVRAPHTSGNQSDYFLVDAGSEKAARKITDIVNDALAHHGAHPSVKHFHVKKNGSVDHAHGEESRWLAFDIRGGGEIVLEAAESKMYRIRALLESSEKTPHHGRGGS